MTKDDELGLNVMQVGIDLDCRICERRTDKMTGVDNYLLEFVQVGFTLVIPQTRYILRQPKRLGRLPVFNKAPFVGRDNGVILIAVLEVSQSS